MVKNKLTMDNIKLLKDFRKFAMNNGASTNVMDDYIRHFPTSYVNPMVLEERTMNVTSIDVYSRLLMDRILFLGNEINADVANIMSAQLLWLESQGDEDITIQISSPGGSIYDGYNILDTMNYIKPDISTICMGMVASMATIIASSGTKGKRFILPHARFLIHQPMSGMREGTQCSDIQIHAKEIEALKTELTSILTKNSNLDYDTVEKMCDRDTIMTAKEAVQNGFVDEIIDAK